MKRFLIFLVAIITTVCIGVTFYQFAKNDEVIKVNTETIYINYGEKLSLDDIGFSRTEASKETKINFNAGGDDVTSIIKFDSATQCYIPTSVGGSTTIKITTSNRKYKSFSIDVMVGIGTEESPYYIKSEKQLFDVTNAHIDQNAYFKLVDDIELTETHSPIGYINNSNKEFIGTFNGNFHTISNLKVDSCDYAGLFAIIGAGSSVSNLKITNAKFEGDYSNLGTVAGKSFGTINRVMVIDTTITNTKTVSNTGGLVGYLETDPSKSYIANVIRSAVYTENGALINANGTLGGLVGLSNCAQIHACYTNLKLKNDTSSPTGGLVGSFIVNQNSYIRESYAVCELDVKVAGNIVGDISLDASTDIDKLKKNLVLVGLYYNKDLNNFAGAGSDAYDFVKASNYAINGKTTEQLKTKNTYTYYITASGNIKEWDNAWYRVDGEYPTLTSANKFDDISLNDKEDVLAPDDGFNNNPDEPLNPHAVEIYNINDLLTYFQPSDTSTKITGTYILRSHIDLGGRDWIPVMFEGTLKSSDGQKYKISNFNIVSNEKTSGYYLGFFYSLTSARIENIIFSDVTIGEIEAQSAGIIVGYIGGTVTIKNVDIINSSISAKTTYSGLVAGYIKYIARLERCVANDSLITNALRAGGIVGYACEDAYIVYCSTLHISLSGINRIGGIVAQNNGYINSCVFKGTLSSSSTPTEQCARIGGICASNFNTIEFSTSYAEISVTNTSEKTYFVAGISSYNEGLITYSNAYGDNYSAKDSTSEVYIAGLVGSNYGEIEYSVADITTIGSVNNNIHSSGLVSANFGGKIFGCFMFGNLYGYRVAGLVIQNTNNGIIDSCMTAKTSELISYNKDTDSQKVIDLYRAEYKGVKVAGLVMLFNNGEIKNCIVNANLNSTSEDGYVAGFAGSMPGDKKSFGTMSHCIANVNLKTESGKAYLALAVENGLFNKIRSTGTITQCVITDEFKTNIIKPEYSKNLFGKDQKPGSESNYVVANIEQMKLFELYKTSDCNFDISAGIYNSYWLYVNEYHLPLPRAILDVFGYEIIGLI